MLNLPTVPPSFPTCVVQCSAFAQPAAAAGTMPFTRAMAAPRGYTAMCAREPASCAALLGPGRGEPAADAGPDRPLADPVAELQRINRRVNQAVDQLPDMVTSGVPELWRRPGRRFGAAGDCEDLAIEKRMELLADGFPPENLYYAVGYRRDLGLHAVLIASTQAGDVVLDSRTPYIVPWRRAPYTWVMRQLSGAPGDWARVEADTPATPVAVAVAAQPSQSGADDSSPDAADARRPAA